MIASAPKIQVFLSYANADYTRGVQRLKPLLESSGYEVYSFRDHPPAPELDFGSNVQTALQKAEYVVVLWSRNAEREQKYVLKEVSLARKLRKYIMLVLLDDVKTPPVLLAMADGIRVSEHGINWEGVVAQRLAVWVDHPPKRPPSDDPSTAPKWVNGLTFVLCAGVAAYLGREKAAELIKVLSR